MLARKGIFAKPSMGQTREARAAYAAKSCGARLTAPIILQFDVLCNSFVPFFPKFQKNSYFVAAPAVGVAVKLHSDGQNAISHCPCYVDIRFRCAMEPSPRCTVTLGSSCTVIFDQVRKARVRSTLAQHNTGNVKRDSDHRNPFSRQYSP